MLFSGVGGHGGWGVCIYDRVDSCIVVAIVTPFLLVCIRNGYQSFAFAKVLYFMREAVTALAGPHGATDGCDPESLPRACSVAVHVCHGVFKEREI